MSAAPSQPAPVPQQAAPAPPESNLAAAGCRRISPRPLSAPRPGSLTATAGGSPAGSWVRQAVGPGGPGPLRPGCPSRGGGREGAQCPAVHVGMAALCLPVRLPQQRLEWEPTRGEHLVGNSCFSPVISLWNTKSRTCRGFPPSSRGARCSLVPAHGKSCQSSCRFLTL